MAKIFDVKEAAEYLGLHPDTVRRLARQGEIPCFKVGGSWRFKEKTLEDWATAQQETRPGGDILIVDDEEQIISLLSRILYNKKFRVATFKDAQDAVLHLDTVKPDLLVTDLYMPKMNGAQLIKEARSRYPDMPIMVITGFPDSDLMMEAMDYSPFLMLAKPVKPKKFLEAVAMGLKEKDLNSD